MEPDRDFLKTYRQTLDRETLSEEQKTDMIRQLQRTARSSPEARRSWRYRRLSAGIGLVCAAAVLILLMMPWQTAEPAASASLPLLPMNSSMAAGPGFGGLGAVGWFYQTENPRTADSWPDSLPVYRYEEPAAGRLLDAASSEVAKHTLLSLMDQLGLDHSLLQEEDPEPGLLNSSVWAMTGWGRLDLIDRDTGYLFVNGSIPFAADSQTEAEAQMQNLIRSYSTLFPIQNPVVEFRPVRRTETDTRWIIRIYEDRQDPEENLIASETRAIEIRTGDQAVQGILYPVSSLQQTDRYPVITREDVMQTMTVPAGSNPAQEENIWLIWKPDASGTWLIPWYRLYLEKQDGGFELFDYPAIDPAYIQ